MYVCMYVCVYVCVYVCNDHLLCCGHSSRDQFLSVPWGAEPTYREVRGRGEGQIPRGSPLLGSSETCTQLLANHQTKCYRQHSQMHDHFIANSPFPHLLMCLSLLSLLASCYVLFNGRTLQLGVICPTIMPCPIEKTMVTCHGTSVLVPAVPAVTIFLPVFVYDLQLISQPVH